MLVMDTTEAQMREQLVVLIEPLLDSGMEIDPLVDASIQAMKLQGLRFKRSGYIAAQGLWK